MTKNLLTSKLLFGGYTLFFSLLCFSAAAQLEVTVIGEDVRCFGLASGTATATVSNATLPVTYAWSNGGTTAIITNLNAGTYGVTVTDADGATASGSVTLSQPTAVTATITDPDQCEGPYIIAAEPEGGVIPYTYNWSTGADTRGITVPVGSYCVTVVDANLCGYVACTTIEENPPSVTLVGVDAQCNDADDGSITANPSGGTPPYTYAWSNGESSQTIDNLAPGGYQVTLTDARGCMATASTSISEPPAITGNIFGDASVCPGVADAFIRIAPTGGTPPYSYVWSPGGFTGQGVGPLPAGMYSVTVTDANECTIVRSFVILTSEDVEVEITGDELLCGAGTTGTLTASPVNGPVDQYTYEWSTGATSPIITNVSAGEYTVTATDANGCTGTATATVRTIDLSVTLSSTPTNCVDGMDGTATAVATGGDTPYTYLWSNGATTATITGLSAGTYGITVTEANDCNVSGSIVVRDPADIVITATPTKVSCPEGADGAVNVSVTGGTTPYTYLWSNGATTEDLDNLTAGTYDLTVTDANGCTETASVTVTEPEEIVISPIINNLTCADDNSGSISLSVVGGGTTPYSYLWSNGATTANIDNLGMGAYSVTVTDANNCEAMATYQLTQPPALMVSGTPTNVDCFDDLTGSVDLTVSGGSGTYSYLWSNGATTQDLTGVAVGIYTVTVTDANECTATEEFTVNQPPAIEIIVSNTTDVSCNGGSDGSIDVTVSGGVQPYTFGWSNGASTEDLDALAAGTYVLTVTDANGCPATATVIINEPPALNLTAVVTPVACAGDATGAIDLTVTGGTPAYTYAWSNGATTQDLNGLVAGDYSVTITDANGCTDSETFNVTATSEVMITGEVTSVLCNGDATGAIDLSVSGGTGIYTYLWSNGAATQDLSGLTAGDYSVTVTDANECQQTANFAVTEPDAIALTVTAPNITCGGTETGTITVFPSGGTGPYTYLWSNGDTGSMITNIAAGTYTVTVTDANGCTDVTSGIILGELPELTCAVNIVQEATTGDNGELTVSPDGGTIPYTYAWSTGATTQSIDNLPAGTYSVTVTDANGCTTDCTASLRALSGIGDFVWEDFNVNGQQDSGEPGIEDYPVYLKNVAGEIIDSTRTDANGNYSFMGLEPGTYSILFINPPGGRRTLANMGDDVTDSDGDPDMDGMTQTYTLAPGEFNMTVDAGFVAGPTGAITDPCNCLNNNTTDFDGQLLEILDVIANPGQTWTIVDRTFMYDINSPAPPAPPILLPIGTVIPQKEILEDDPTMAKYQLEFLLVDSFRYTVTVTNGVFELEFSNQCFYPEVRYTELPPDELCRFAEPIDLDGFGQLNGVPLPGEVVFTVNGEEVDQIDPSGFAPGEYTITAEFTPDDPEECIPILERQVLIIGECDAKIGDFVWEDTNINGLQDPGEPGIPDVKVTVTSEDGTYMDMTTTDWTGMYMFFVPPGTYKVTFEQPEGLDPTTPNAGDDAADSDMNPSTFMTPFYTVGPNEMNLTIDAGFVNPCIDNINNPGTIAASQELCGPGNIPQPFTEVAPATGGVGEIQYLWMYNTEDPGQDISYWQSIPDSDSPTYAPGPIYETTYFTRCVRRANCPYLESNILTVEVGTDAVASVSGPSTVCVGEEAIFQASNPGNGAQISWVFSGSSSVSSSNSATVSTTWATFGNFSVTLSVTRNGCTSTQVFNVSVVNNPGRCGGNLVANGAVNDLATRNVTVEWQVPADGTDYRFSVERSTNGASFLPVGEVTAPAFISGGDMAIFRFDDISPLAGRTFYQVRLIDTEFGDMMSNLVELQLAQPSSSLGRIFPNPANNGMIHVEMQEMATEAESFSVQVYDVRGNTMGQREFLPLGTGVLNLQTDGLTAGLYFVRLTAGGQTETHRVIIE